MRCETLKYWDLVCLVLEFWQLLIWKLWKYGCLMKQHFISILINAKYVNEGVECYENVAERQRLTPILTSIFQTSCKVFHHHGMGYHGLQGISWLNTLNWCKFKRLLMYILTLLLEVNLTQRVGQNGRHFADNIFKCIFLNEDVGISIKISLKFVPKDLINNIPALVQIMAWRRTAMKPRQAWTVSGVCVAGDDVDRLVQERR